MHHFMTSQALRLKQSLWMGALFVLAAGASQTVRAQDGIQAPLGADISWVGPERWSALDTPVISSHAFKAQYDLRSALPKARLGIGLAGSAWFVQASSGAGLSQRSQLFIRDTQSDVPGWRLTPATVASVGLGGSLLRPGAAVTIDPNTPSYNLAGGWLTHLGDGTVLSILGTAGVAPSWSNWTARDEAGRQFWGPRIQMQKSVNEKIDAFAAAGATFYSERGIQAHLLGPRRETLYDLTVGLNWTVAKGLSVRPQLSFIRNGSTSSDSYAFDRADTSVNLRFDY